VRNFYYLLYLAGSLIIADQGFEILASLSIASPSPGSATWRFGAIGVVVGRVAILMVGDVFLYFAAIGLQHRHVLRGLGWVHLVLAALGFVAFAVFALDVIEVRSRTSAAMRGSVDLAAVRAGAVVLLTSGLFLWAGIATTRQTRRTRHKGSPHEAPPLVTRFRRLRGR